MASNFYKISPDSLFKYSILLVIVFLGCTKPVHSPPDIEVNESVIKPSITFSSDSLYATVTTNFSLTDFDLLSSRAHQPIKIEYLTRLAYPGLHDSTIINYSNILKNTIPFNQRSRNLQNIKSQEGAIIAYYSLDTTWVFPNIRNKINTFNSKFPIMPLFDRDGEIPDFNKLIPTPKLLLPIEKLNVPTRASRLPNAPRDYRSGIHRGIDFFSNWGTEVKSVADGIVIRSDLFYKEIPAGFRVDILKQAARLKRTPSDIFNELLLGQAIIIDHGFNLFPGYRSITIYAHLSYIEKKISPGSKVEAGQILGRSGNTGTRPSTLGTKEESHLHWELILQDAKGEYYFGQDMDYESLLPALNQIFKN